MEIRNCKKSVLYDLYPSKIHPRSHFTPTLKRYGINYRLKGITPLQAIIQIPKEPRLETLLKAKQYSLLNYCTSSNTLDKHWSSVKICLRNKYIVKNAFMWFDYLHLLEKYKKDLHNAHYVCPSNLKDEHDRYVKKRNNDYKKEHAVQMHEAAIRKEERLQKLIEEMKKNDIRYKEEKSKYFDIQFTDGVLIICVLKDIQEFKDEGDKLHHCVFTNEYFNRTESLILSARIDGKPIETIEISLISLKVMQCYGTNNQNSEYHERILKLMNQNLNLISQRLAS